MERKPFKVCDSEISASIGSSLEGFLKAYRTKEAATIGNAQAGVRLALKHTKR